MNAPILITCARGMAPILQEELRVLGFAVAHIYDSAVEVSAGPADVMRLNLWLRTAHRVLLPLTRVGALNADDLYNTLRAFPWENILHADGYVCITSNVKNDTIRDSRFANLRVKDAIVDRLLEKSGRRPDSGPERNGAVIHLDWRDRDARLFIDTSGDALNRRGYRKIALQAPMIETLAAGCVLASPWRGGGNLVNPMCGSGTIAIEAAMIGLNRAPGLLRKNFGFMHIKGYREDEWKKLRAETQQAGTSSLKGKIIATDISPKAIDAARHNAADAGVADAIDFNACDFRETPVPPGGGVVMFNPEYGERMGDAEKLGPVYKAMGDFLKQKCLGYRGYIFTGNLKLAKMIGLRSSRRIMMYNGPLECRLLEFEMYEGTRDPGSGS